MADIRVERKGGSRVWIWVLLAVIVIALALFLLYQAGYIQLPASVDVGAAGLNHTPVAQLLVSATLQS